MAYSIEKVNRDVEFKNVHGNYYEPFKEIIRLWNDPAKKGLEAYNDTTQDIHSIIAHAIEKDIRIRACGSLWSLSRVPYVNGGHIFSYNEEDEQDMDVKFFLPDNVVFGEIPASNLLFAQCGTTIKEINHYCALKGQSIQTTGAGNGQTIAGAMSTGVHGSAINIGSIQDTVVGLHIIKGPDSSDSVFVQSDKQKVVTKEFTDSINATLIEDDELFKAALVNLGGFGYVHGVLIETKDIFLLHNQIFELSIDRVFQFTKSLNINDLGLNFGDFDASQLYHVKFYINQYDETVRAEVMFSDTEIERKMDRPPFLKYNKDFLLPVIKLGSFLFKKSISKQINKRLPEPGKTEVGLIGNIFGDTTNMRDGQFACAIAVDSKDAEIAYKLMIEPITKRKRNWIPSVFSMRFVPKSKATMAFTKFEMNCVIDIDGIETKGTKKYADKITSILEKKNVDHTWHWGKYNSMDRAFMDKYLKEERTQWLKKRLDFFGDKVYSTFTSDYLRERGL